MLKKQLLPTLGIIVGLLLGVMISKPAHGLVQIRAGYGLQTVEPNQVGSFPTYSKLTGFNADLIFTPPLFPLGFGLRHETLGNEESSSYGEIEVGVTRTSGLVTFRLIDTLIYIGGIGSFGISHGGETTLNPKGGNSSTVDNDISGSYSIGIEGGVKLLGFLVGVELGYLDLEIGDNSAKQELNGAYTKFHLGLDF